jgi:hypothetical protein
MINSVKRKIEKKQTTTIDEMKKKTQYRKFKRETKRSDGQSEGEIEKKREKSNRKETNQIAKSAQKAYKL